MPICAVLPLILPHGFHTTERKKMKDLKIRLNSILTVSSILFNIILLSTLLVVSYKMGYLGRSFNTFTANVIEFPTDTLARQYGWQNEVRYQTIIAQNKQYNACLFGDSISSNLGNNLGDRTFNFALPGMSTISLIDQLKILKTAQVKCKQAIIAIGTNDADYRTTNDVFVKNMKSSIADVKDMGATRIILIPAFYSTVAASHDASMAGTVDRVEAINALIRQVAKTEKVSISESTIKPLFDGQALKENLTTDGVHLNADGRQIYRQGLLKLLSSSSQK